MDTAEIIAALGGCRATADACGLLPNSVAQWQRRRRIPARHAARIASLARARGRPDITEKLLLRLWNVARA